MWHRGWVFAALFVFLPTAAFSQQDILVDGEVHHLGNDDVEDWADVAVSPEGSRLDLEFEAVANSHEVILSVLHQDIHNLWTIVVNGEAVGTLVQTADRGTYPYPLPKGVLKDGVNTISFQPDDPADDILLGEVRIFWATVAEHYQLGRLEVSVVGPVGEPLPVRITIEPKEGPLPEIFDVVGNHTAVRPGVVYVGDGHATFSVPGGHYTVTASKGVEWGLDQAQVDVVFGSEESIHLAVEREVDTSGYISADTHIHTVTFSGHGDATIEERMVTLAAEGVELAVATDHNHNIDYRPWQEEMGFNPFFTSVIGNEVDNELGHYTAFPLDVDDEVPQTRGKDWTETMREMRAKGAKVILLNHPRWPAIDTGPFGKTTLNRHSGRRVVNTPFLFDGIEVINATDLKVDPLYIVQDWFALLNHGELLVGVGSTDSHTVGEHVGKGRTYIASSTDDPANLDVDALSDALLEGRASISLGIFCDVLVNGQAGMGDQVEPEDGVLDVALTVRSPAWVTPRSAIVYLNGVEAARMDFGEQEEGPFAMTAEFRIPAPAFDAHLVCVVVGDGEEAAFWPTMEDYTFGATNPVWIDVDGDGVWRSPRTTAYGLMMSRKAVADGTGPVESLEDLVQRCDDAIAIQLLDQAFAERPWPLTQEQVDAMIGEKDRPLLQEYCESHLLHFRPREVGNRNR